MKDFKGARAFLMIPVGIARDKELLKKPKAILLMGEIVSMFNVTGEFFMSNAEIAKRLDVTSRSVKENMRMLDDKGLIKRENIYADKARKVITGRKITPGKNLVTVASLGWSSTDHESGVHDNTRVVSGASPKYNKIIDQSNRTSNTSSSSKPSSSNDEIKDPFAEQQDDDDEKIVNGLIGMFLGEARISGPAPYEREHIKRQLLKMGRANAIDFMYTMTNKISTSSISDPIAYLERSLMNAKGGETNG